MKILPNVRRPKIGTKYEHYVTLPYKKGDYTSKWTIVGEDINYGKPIWILEEIRDDNIKMPSYDFKDEIEERLRSGHTVIIK